MISKKTFPYLAGILLLTLGIQNNFAQCYEVVWAEEFNYTGFPDPTIWNMEVGNNNGSNNEREYYTKNDSDNCYVDSGRMVIRAIKENLGGQAYTSARINTKGKVEFKYGKVEARIRLPYGQGIWPAFWMLGSNISQVSWPKCGEMDIMEMIGGSGDRNRTVYGTNHWADANNNHAQFGGSKKLASGIFADDYHIFAIQWDSLKVSWYLDGLKYVTLDITPAALSEFRQNYFIIINLAVGGDWPGYPDGTTVFPQRMEVDYVRVSKLVNVEKIQGQDSAFAKEKNLGYSLPVAEGRQFLWTVPEGASLVTRADSNAVVVDWGCSTGDLACHITTACSSEVVLSKTIKVRQLKIEGPKFYDQTAGNLFFFVPEMSETRYLWEIPGDATFISTDTMANAEVSWGTGSGTVNLQISNSCGTTELSTKLYKYGQYPYPDPESPFIIPGTINSTSYDFGGEGVAYHDTGKGNQGIGGPRTDENVDTQTSPSFPYVSNVVTSEWLDYTIKVPVPGYYKISMQVASGNTVNLGPIRVLVNGEQRIADINVTNTGGWTTFTTISGRLLNLNATDTILHIEAVKGGFYLGPITLTVDNSLSMQDVKAGNTNIDLFPNPVNDVLNINMHLSAPGNVSYRLSDVSGKQVLSGISKNPGSGDQTIKISEGLSKLNPGLYFIELRLNDQKYFSKFLKN